MAFTQYYMILNLLLGWMTMILIGLLNTGNI